VNALTLSRFGMPSSGKRSGISVSVRQLKTPTFMREFGGERMHPSERGKGNAWAQWRKGSYRP